MDDINNLSREELIKRLELLQNENKLLKEKISFLSNTAYHDQLTGLLNRNCLNSTEQYGSSIMIDVDNFKNINDEFGHLIGDKALEEMGQIILDSINPGDKAIRYGGDEFLVLRESDNEEEALEIITRIQKGIENMRLQIKVSLSFGYFVGLEHPLHESILYADEALLYSKGSGKNQLQKFDINNMSR